VPRLSNGDYLINRAFLQDAWELFPSVFTRLSYNEQIELHSFYRPSKDWTDHEAIDHRKRISKQQPSLPNRVGKHFVRIDQHAKALQEQLAKRPAQPVRVLAKSSRSKGTRNIRVRVLARPEPDLHKLALVLLDVAKDMQAEQDHEEQQEKVA
jgi:hypothetical protein